MSRPRCCLVGLVAGAVAASACSSDGPSVSRAWCTAASPDVEVAFTSADDEGRWAREGRGTPRFVELWRAGGLNEGEALAFPVGASVSSDGRLAIADFMLKELTVVDADGTWNARWAVPGRGPGELASPVAATWAADGASVAVFDLVNPRVLFIREGEPVRSDLRLPFRVPAQIYASGSLAWAGVTPAGHAIVEPSPTPVADPENPDLAGIRSVFLVAAPNAPSFDTLLTGMAPGLGESRFGSTFAPGWPRLTVAVGPSGEIAVGGEDGRYRVRFVTPGGTPTRIVCRDAPPLPSADRELEPPEGAEDAYTEALANALAAAERPDTLAPLGRLFLSREGNLWVQRDRPSALRFGDHLYGVPGALYDVFDPDGTYLGEVRAPENARLQAALGDTVWAYEIGELDETWVVAYELRFGPHEDPGP